MKFEYSYFNIQGTKAPALTIARLNIYDYNTSEQLDYEKANGRATKMLLEGQATKALPLIKKMLVVCMETMLRTNWLLLNIYVTCS